MPLFSVEIVFPTVVIAESESDAYKKAVRLGSTVARDSDPGVEVVGEIDSLSQLPEGWDRECLPYGGDRETRISEILPST